MLTQPIFVIKILIVDLRASLTSYISQLYKISSFVVENNHLILGGVVALRGDQNRPFLSPT